MGFPVDVDDAPSAVAVGPRTVWVVHEGSGTLATVDPRRNEMVGALISVGGRPRYVVIAGTAVWVSNFDAGTVTRVSLASQGVTARIPVGRQPVGNGRGAWGDLGRQP